MQDLCHTSTTEGTTAMPMTTGLRRSLHRHGQPNEPLHPPIRQRIRQRILPPIHQRIRQLLNLTVPHCQAQAVEVAAEASEANNNSNKNQRSSSSHNKNAERRAGF